MNDNSNKIYGLTTDTANGGREVDCYLVGCRASDGGWSDSVSESFLAYTAILGDVINRLYNVADRAKKTEDVISPSKVSGFESTVDSLSGELSRI